jgi:hypothetical protein
MNTASKVRFPVWLPGVYGALVVGLVVHLLLQVAGRDAFTWMDPYQYHAYAVAVAEGREAALDYPVASSYPLLLGQALRINDSMPFALSMNAVWLVVLAGSLLALCRRYTLDLLAPALLLAVMASPALFGLSRELYLEFPLTAVVALQLALWVNRDRMPAGRFWILFGGVFLLGFSMKMTFPLFIAGPLVLDGVRRLRAGDLPGLALMVAAVVGPVLAALAITYVVSPRAFEYYLSQGNTVIPPMRLIGPSETLSVSALLYYPEQLVRNGLLLFAPVTLVAVWQSLPDRRGDEHERDTTADLWLAFLVPLVVFALIPVREPRHLMPVMVPLLMLTGLGVFRLVGESSRRRGLAAVALSLLAVAQYGVVAAERVPVSYLLDQPIRREAVLEGLFRASPDAATFILPDGRPDAERWRFTRNTVLSGLDPDEALALTWALIPGVTINLDGYPDDGDRVSDIGYQVYTDLFLLSAFNTYNQRCGWPAWYQTLDRETAIAHANGAVVAVPGNEPPPDWPGFRTVANLPLEDGRSIFLLIPETPPSTSFRRLYGERYLAGRTDAHEAVLNAVYRDLFLDAFLRGDQSSLENLPSLFPQGFVPGRAMHEIYFFPVYQNLLARLQAAMTDSPGTSPLP